MCACPGDGIGIQGDGVDAAVHQKFGELGMVGRRLTTDAYLAALLVRYPDYLFDHAFDGLVAGVEQAFEYGGIAVDAQHQLGQVVAADGEAVKAPSELVGENHVGGNLAHHIDLESGGTAPQSGLRHCLQHLVCFPGGPAEGDHDNDIVKAHFFARATNRLALQLEALPVQRVIVTGGAAESEHGVLLLELEVLASQQAPVFVGLEVRHAHDHRSRILGCSDLGDGTGEVVDKIVGGLRKVVVEIGYLPGDLRVRDLVRMHQGHGVDADLAGDNEFDPGQADPGDRELPPLQGAVRQGCIDHQRGAGRRQVRQADGLAGEREGTLIHLAGCTVGAADGDVHAVVQQFRGIAAADDSGFLQFATDDGRMAGGAAAVGDNAGGLAHDRDPVRVCALGDQNGALGEMLHVVRILDYTDRTAGDGAADTGALQQHLALLCQLVAHEDTAVFL